MDINQNIEIIIKSLKDKNEYIIKHHRELLPDWEEIPKTIVFVFFKSQYLLDGNNLLRENLEKDRLLLEFNQLGKEFYHLSKKERILSEIICPRSGYPQYSNKGNQIFSIQQLVKKHLPSFTVKSGQCSLIHPVWGQAIYPSIMLSLAPPTKIKLMIQQCSYDRIDQNIGK
jgi:hypothetical protein